MHVARVNTPPPYSAPSATWRDASDADPIRSAVPPPRYDGVIRACDFPSFTIRIPERAGGLPLLPWDSVGQLTHALEGRVLADPRLHAWTESFRERLTSVDQITHRMRTEVEPIAFETAYAARVPFPIICTPEMHAAISAYYEALDAFLMDLPQWLSSDQAEGEREGEGSPGQLALTRLSGLTASVRDLDEHLGVLPPPACRPSVPWTAASLLAGVGGLVGAVWLPPMSDDPQRPSNASMVVRVLMSFAGFVPFFVLSARRAYIDDSDSEALRKLKFDIAKVQTVLSSLAAIVRGEAAGTVPTAQ